MNRQSSVELTKASGNITECFCQISRYDGEGLRYETEKNGKTIRFLYDRGELAEETGEDSHTSYTRGYDPLVLIRNGAERSYFVPDEMGSTLFLLDKDHGIQKTYRYDAFGNILKETGDISSRLTYTGQMYDGETGQYYLRARFYNPASGRFLQEDIYRGDGLNLYAYCANNPVMYYDPSGFIKLPCILKHTPETDLYVSTDAIAVSEKKAINSGHSYESAVREILYENNNVPHKQRKCSAVVDGVKVNGVADNIVNFDGKYIAVDAKYVRDWSATLRNPDSPIDTRDFAFREQTEMLKQAQKFSVAFDNIVYHTNSIDLANYYSEVFQNAGIKNFEFVITPIKK